MSTDTSLEAYAKVLPHVPNMRERVKKLIASSPAGLTCFEIENMTDMVRSSVSSRITDLQRLGEIRDSGERRLTASGCKARVYVVVE